MAKNNKRPRQQVEKAFELLDLGSNGMASILMVFSGAGMASPSPERMFECKTCRRQFPSFQALGGHRANHKKPRVAARPKVHGCSICGLEFAIGQALGGHMRRHRAAMPAGPVSLELGIGMTGLIREEDDGAAEATGRLSRA